MKTKYLYKYTKEDGGIAVLNSRVKDYQPIIRIEADEGKLVTNGTVYGKALTVGYEELDGYYEVEDTDAVESEDAEI